MSVSVKVVFFASIREELGCSELLLELPSGSGIAALITRLTEQRGEPWRQALTAENVRVAVNTELTREDCRIEDGDEVAFFPPVTGG